MDQEKVKGEQEAAARMIWQAVRALEDGAVTAQEGVYLCRARAELLDKLRPRAKRWIARTSIDAAQLVLRQLASDLEELAIDE